MVEWGGGVVVVAVAEEYGGKEVLGFAHWNFSTEPDAGKKSGCATQL